MKIAASLFAAATLSFNAFAQEVPNGIWVRPGFKLTVAESSIKAPRFLENGPDGALFVSVPREGKIIACRDKDKDGKFESITTFVEGHDPKNILQGMQWHDGWLWVAEISAMYKCRDKDGDGKAEEKIKVIGEDQLPISGGGHRCSSITAGFTPMWATRATPRMSR
jgi:glucose/arabinose dehydrogenase